MQTWSKGIGFFHWSQKQSATSLWLEVCIEKSLLIASYEPKLICRKGTRRPSTRDCPDDPDGIHDVDKCELCSLVRQDAVQMQANDTNKAASSSPSKSTKKYLCSECLTPIGKGISHKCNKETLQLNLAKLDETAKQRMAARGKVITENCNLLWASS